MLEHERFANGKTPLFYLGRDADEVLTIAATLEQVVRESLPVVEDEPE